MELAEQFKQHLLNDELDTFSFFLGLSESDQKSLKPIMEELATEDPSVYVYDPYGDYLISRKLSSASQLKICASYLYNHTTFKKYFMRLGRGYYEYEYYKIYRPKWLLSDFKENAIWIRYPHWLGNIPYGLQFDDADIVNALVSSTSYWNYETKENVFDISHFYSYPIVLDQHIWLIFNEPSEVHLVDRYHRVQGWQGIIAQLVEDKKIDRQRVLKECLLTTTRNFNKLAAGWFYDLFELLEPTEEEIIGLMPEFMLVLNGTHTKPINNVLKLFKTLCQRDEFQTDEFLTISEVLLASDVKAVINNTFAVFDKIAKAYPKKREELSTLACTALIHNDEKIQTKVAKFVLKYGDITDESLSGNIANYYPDLFSSVKTLLEPFSLDTHEEVADIECEYTPINPLDDAHRINIPDSFDDQIFFVTQAFENNEPYHFDVYLAVMASLIPQINQDNIHHLAPAMKNAMRALTSSGNRTGYVDYLMGAYFVNCIKALTEKYDAKPLKTLYKKIAEPKRGWYPRQIGDSFTTDITELNLPFPSMHIWVDMLLFSRELADKKQPLPMLSTPTHSPCFIDVPTFCERLSVYQKYNIDVNTTDFQLAVSRLVVSEGDTYTHELTGEYADIVDYLRTDEPLDFSKCHTHELWATVVYRKDVHVFNSYIAHFELPLSYLSAPMSWHMKDNSFTYEDYDRRTDTKEEITVHYFTLYQQFIPTNTQNMDDLPTYFRHFWQGFIKINNQDIPHFLESQDHKRALCLAPNKPAMVMMLVIADSVYGSGIEAESERSITSILPILMQIWKKDFDESCYLYVACVMLVDIKACRQLSSELWIQAVSANNIDNKRLGTILGRLEYDEYAPLKRFTDLINQQLLNISTLHNQALIMLISNMLPAMNDTPIKGTKKLLELFMELLTVTRAKLVNLENQEQISEKLTTWAETKSLKTVIKKLQAV